MSLEKAIEHCEKNKIKYSEYQKELYAKKEISVKQKIEQYKRNRDAYGRLGYKIQYRGV